MTLHRNAEWNAKLLNALETVGAPIASITIIYSDIPEVGLMAGKSRTAVLTVRDQATHALSQVVAGQTNAEYDAMIIANAKNLGATEVIVTRA